MSTTTASPLLSDAVEPQCVDRAVARGRSIRRSFAARRTGWLSWRTSGSAPVGALLLGRQSSHQVAVRLTTPSDAGNHAERRQAADPDRSRSTSLRSSATRAGFSHGSASRRNVT